MEKTLEDLRNEWYTEEEKRSQAALAYAQALEAHDRAQDRAQAARVAYQLALNAQAVRS